MEYKGKKSNKKNYTTNVVMLLLLLQRCESCFVVSPVVILGPTLSMRTEHISSLNSLINKKWSNSGQEIPCSQSIQFMVQRFIRPGLNQSLLGSVTSVPRGRWGCGDNVNHELRATYNKQHKQTNSPIWTWLKRHEFSFYLKNLFLVQPQSLIAIKHL